MTKGFFSLLRWRSDVTRDEAKNIAVLLVAPEEGVGAIRSVPVSSVSGRLREQGLVDSMIEQLHDRMLGARHEDPKLLTELHDSLTHSLYVTEPRPIAVTDVDQALKALYRAYLHTPRSPRGQTKGVVLDHVVSTLRARGYTVSRGDEINDFLFDAVVAEGEQPARVLGILSFGAPRKDWTPILHDAGHFLFALQHVHLPATAVIQRPSEMSETSAKPAFERVSRWLHDAKVPVVTPDEVGSKQLQLGQG